MLVFLFFSALLLAPVLQGFWSFRAQFVFEAAVFATGGLWLFREALSRGLPQGPGGRENLPLLGAAFFSFLGAALSPVRTLVMADWWSFFSGLFMLVLAGELSGEQRKKTDWGLRLAAWIMAALGIYQAFVLKGAEISASLTNPNALALFALMLIPMALVWRDFFLFGALLALLAATRSAAAWLAALAAAGCYGWDRIKKEEAGKNWPLLAILAGAAVLAVWGLEPRSVSDRLLWWRSALKMFSDSPVLGFGHGAFAWLYPAYHRPEAAGLSSVYVHNYFLEFLAENGALASTCWFWAVYLKLKAVSGMKRYALIAALVHSLADFGLAVPANFFIFCYLLGERRSETPPSPRLWRTSPPPALPDKKTATAVAALAVLVLAHGLGVFFRQGGLERLRESALSAYSAGDYAKAAGTLEAAYIATPENPLIPRLQGRIRLAAGMKKKDRAMLFRAAVALERALLLNPYDSGVYGDLEFIYAMTGLERSKAHLLERKKEFFKW